MFGTMIVEPDYHFFGYLRESLGPLISPGRSNVPHPLSTSAADSKAHAAPLAPSFPVPLFLSHSARFTSGLSPFPGSDSS